MSPALTEPTALPQLLALDLMGFDICRLSFYRWLVQHGRHPEFPPDAPGDIVGGLAPPSPPGR